MKHHLMSQFHSIAYQIGEQLQVEHGKLMNIKHNTSFDDDDRLSEVFQLWMDRDTTDVSWRKVLYVIWNRPIENRSLHDEVMAFLSCPHIQQEYLSCGELCIYIIH